VIDETPAGEIWMVRMPGRLTVCGIIQIIFEKTTTFFDGRIPEGTTAPGMFESFLKRRPFSPGQPCRGI